MISTGIYYLSDSLPSLSSNLPIEGCTNCYLFVIAMSSVRVTQIVLPGNVPYISYRSTLTDSNKWENWKIIK